MGMDTEHKNWLSPFPYICCLILIYPAGNRSVPGGKKYFPSEENIFPYWKVIGL